MKLQHLELGAAGTRLSVSAGLELDHRRFGWSPKIDGAFVYVATDRAGRIVTMLHRSGRAVSQEEADGLYGQPIGLPDSSLSGELECHTEHSVRARAARGWAALHVFDASRIAGRSAASLPALQRYDRLHRWQAAAECNDPSIARLDWWTQDETGRNHDNATGRFTVAKPRDLRRLPIVRIHRGASAAELLWQEHVIRGGGEGLVAVRLDARLGARNAKRKIKLSEDLDVTILSFDRRAARVSWKGVTFVVSAVNKQLRAGDVYTCRVDGWYESSITPKFARLIARRDDLSPQGSPC